jgi:hypothetical protein
MRNRSSWLLSVIAVSVCAVLVLGAAIPSAVAAPKGKPPTTPPGVPPGQPFQALQKQIDALSIRVKALEDAAPQPGTMWINPLEFRAGGSTLGLDVAGPGLSVTAGAGGVYVAQVGVQVPLGFSITGATVCYVPGASSSLSSIQILQYGATPALPPSTVLNEVPTGAPAAGAVGCVSTTTAISVDPSAGGAVFLSPGLTFTAADTIVIRSVGLNLTP